MLPTIAKNKPREMKSLLHDQFAFLKEKMKHLDYIPAVI